MENRASNRFCPYGHGSLSAWDSTAAVNKIEENPQKVYTECHTSKIKSFHPVDPTGTIVEQVCFGCGYKAALPYPACCPLCRNPWKVSMALCVTWPELLRLASMQKPIKTEELTPQKLVVPKLKAGQLSLFGGAA